jgi:hypothetical protein
MTNGQSVSLFVFKHKLDAVPEDDELVIEEALFAGDQDQDYVGEAAVRVGEEENSDDESDDEDSDDESDDEENDDENFQ